MPLLFSYGTLQQESVQMATFGRLLESHPDELIGFEQLPATITDAAFVATGADAQQTIVKFNGKRHCRVNGKALEVTNAELAQADRYEPDGFERIATTLASGKRAWVYADTRP